MKKENLKLVLMIFSLVVLNFFLIFGIKKVMAVWQGPTGTPPANQPPGPVLINPENIQLGDIKLNGSAVFGKRVTIGSTTLSSEYQLKVSGNSFIEENLYLGSSGSEIGGNLFAQGKGEFEGNFYALGGLNMLGDEETDVTRITGNLCLNDDCVSSWSEVRGNYGTCGNGILEDGEECDKGAIPDTCFTLGYTGGTLRCKDDCTYNTDWCYTPDRKIIFVTGGTVANSSMSSGTTKGAIKITRNGVEFSGRDAANMICQELAEQAHLQGTFWAWLSGSTYSPNSYFNHANISYWDTTGDTSADHIIANNWADLTDGTLNSPIKYDENGNEVSSACVWTGTNTDGSSLSNSCGNWFLGNEGPTGTTGLTAETDDSWTNNIDTGCDNSCHLYCVQQ